MLPSFCYSLGTKLIKDSTPHFSFWLYSIMVISSFQKRVLMAHNTGSESYLKVNKCNFIISINKKGIYTVVGNKFDIRDTEIPATVQP